MDAQWRRAIWRAWWIAIPVALSTAVSLPITLNYFFGDDLLTLYQVLNQPLGETLLAPYGGHELIVRNALLAALYGLFGANAGVYYWMAVLTHVANVALLAVLIRTLTASERLACFGAVLWGTAPVTEGTIGWYAVYGHARHHRPARRSHRRAPRRTPRRRLARRAARMGGAVVGGKHLLRRGPRLRPGDADHGRPRCRPAARRRWRDS